MLKYLFILFISSTLYANTYYHGGGLVEQSIYIPVDGPIQEASESVNGKTYTGHWRDIYLGDHTLGNYGPLSEVSETSLAQWIQTNIDPTTLQKNGRYFKGQLGASYNFITGYSKPTLTIWRFDDVEFTFIDYGWTANGERNCTLGSDDCPQRIIFSKKHDGNLTYTMDRNVTYTFDLSFYYKKDADGNKSNEETDFYLHLNGQTYEGTFRQQSSDNIWTSTLTRLGEDAPIARIEWDFIAQILRVFDNDGNALN